MKKTSFRYIAPSMLVVALLFGSFAGVVEAKQDGQEKRAEKMAEKDAKKLENSVRKIENEQEREDWEEEREERQESKRSENQSSLTNDSSKNKSKKNGDTLILSVSSTSSSTIALKNQGKPCLVPPGHLIASGWLRKMGFTRVFVEIPCGWLPYGIAKKLGFTPDPSKDKVAPIVSAVTVTDITSTSAFVRWTTNESANSKVYFSTVSPVSTSTATLVSDNTLVTTHAVALTGLTASTTYYYYVTSTDAGNNTTTSSQGSFTTLQTPDTLSPVISSMTVSNLASTTATVSWQTNELATHKLYFGTTTPLSLTTSTVLTKNTFSTSTSFGLTGLSTSTTYYFVGVSKDPSGNTATSSEFSLTTQAN